MERIRIPYNHGKFHKITIEIEIKWKSILLTFAPFSTNILTISSEFFKIAVVRGHEWMSKEYKNSLIDINNKWNEIKKQ